MPINPMQSGPGVAGVMQTGTQAQQVAQPPASSPMAGAPPGGQAIPPQMQALQNQLAQLQQPGAQAGMMQTIMGMLGPQAQGAPMGLGQLMQPMAGPALGAISTPPMLAPGGYRGI